MTTRTLRISVLFLRGGGTEPVHADTVTFIVMAEGLVQEPERPATAYTNRETKTNQQMRKKPPIDLFEHRQSLVMGCTTTLPQE
jgi:hypothetical protein